MNRHRLVAPVESPVGAASRTLAESPARGTGPHRQGGRMRTIDVIRRMTILGAAAAVFSCLFVLSFGYAQHSPRPHDVRIDVVGPATVQSQVRHMLDAAMPGAFDVRAIATQAVAQEH